MKTVVVELKAKAFTGHGIQALLVQVSGDGTVRVWDAVAGHYTTCHILSRSAIARAKRLARAAQADFASPEVQSARPRGVYGDY